MKKCIISSTINIYILKVVLLLVKNILVILKSRYIYRKINTIAPIYELMISAFFNVKTAKYPIIVLISKTSLSFPSFAFSVFLKYIFPPDLFFYNY